MFINKKNNQTLSTFFLLVFSLFLLPSCSKQEEKRTEDLTFDELKQKTLSSLERKKADASIENLEKLISQHPDNQNISEYKLMLADLYFDNGNLPSAYELYKHYTEFYPSDPKAEYASYRSILSKFYQTLKPDCDQTDTDDAIKLCKNFITNPKFHEYKSDVKDIQNTCERKLIDKEVYVYNFYLKKGNYKAAQNRLNYLRNNYLEKNPALEARLLFLECKLEHKQKNKTAVDEKIETLLDKYPDSHFTKMAQRVVNKNVFLF